MQKKVYEYIKRWDMMRPGMKVLVGYSGGADSTALLELLWEYGKEYGVQVQALHVNHGIRGEEAGRDQEFCEKFCAERGIGLKVVEADVPGIAGRDGIGLEEAGRQVRYTAFGREVREGRIDRVALAHHQNDQAETMLFHLMRGTGVRGLRGMEPVRMPYIRPFLCAAREEIVGWLTERGLSWVEDSTNREKEYTRNRIRYEVLAAMEDIRPGSTVRMAGTAERLWEAEDYLENELGRWMEEGVREKDGAYELSLEVFGRMHGLMQKKVVLRCLERLYGSPEAVHAEQVCALADGRRGNRVTLPDSCVAVLEYEKIRLKRGYKTSEPGEVVYCEPGGEYHYMGASFRLTLENCEKIGEIPVNRYTKWFDYDKIKNNAVLRTRRPGDYLELSGGIHKKLKDYLIDQKVPREERDQCILLADGSHVIWVAGMRISERYKVTDRTRRMLKVQMRENGGTKDGEASC